MLTSSSFPQPTLTDPAGFLMNQDCISGREMLLAALSLQTFAIKPEQLRVIFFINLVKSQPSTHREGLPSPCWFLTAFLALCGRHYTKKKKKKPIPIFNPQIWREHLFHTTYMQMRGLDYGLSGQDWFEFAFLIPQCGAQLHVCNMPQWLEW